jgi:hypothetical protein
VPTSLVTHAADLKTSGLPPQLNTRLKKRIVYAMVHEMIANKNSRLLVDNTNVRSSSAADRFSRSD